MTDVWRSAGTIEVRFPVGGLDDGSRTFTLNENTRGLHIAAIALEPNGKRLVSGGGEGRIRLWGIEPQRQESEIDLGWGHHIQGLAWNPRGESVCRRNSSRRALRHTDREAA